MTVRFVAGKGPMRPLE